MNNIIKGAFLATALFGFASFASAANFTNVEFENGDTEIQGNGGETVEATVRVTIPSNEVIECFQWDVLGDGLAPKFKFVGGSRGLEQGTHYIDFDVKLPPNTGTYDLDVQGAGIFGGQASADCDDNVVDDNTFNDALRVVGSSNNDDDDEELGGDNMPSWLAALFAALGIDINNPKPAKPAYCTQLATYAGLYVGMNGPQVSALQSLLMSNGFSIPALTQGVAYGFYGSQTASAHASAKAACN